MTKQCAHCRKRLTHQSDSYQKRAFDDPTFENEFRSAEIHTVVCLNPPAEIEHLSPEYAQWRKGVRARGGIDTAEGDGTVSKRDIAVSPAEVAPLFWKHARHLGELITAGQRVFVHCTASRGRTGTFGVAVLMGLGYTYAEAAGELWSVGSYPEAEEQEAFLLASNR